MEPIDNTVDERGIPKAASPTNVVTALAPSNDVATTTTNTSTTTAGTTNTGTTTGATTDTWAGIDKTGYDKNMSDGRNWATNNWGLDAKATKEKYNNNILDFMDKSPTSQELDAAMKQYGVSAKDIADALASRKPAAAAPFAVQSSGASQLTVDPKTMTVAGQLESVLANDSPLMQQARTRAMQTMNARGLANSSMALGAADSAMYDKALEIAKPDASTYYDAGKTNVGYDNQFKMADKMQAFDLEKIKAQGEQSRLTASYVADTEAKYKSLTQGSSAATSILTKMQDSINAVWANDKITDKTTVIDDIRKNTEESLNLIGAMAGDMDLSAYIKSIGGP